MSASSAADAMRPMQFFPPHPPPPSSLPPAPHADSGRPGKERGLPQRVTPRPKNSISQGKCLQDTGKETTRQLKLGSYTAWAGAHCRAPAALHRRPPGTPGAALGLPRPPHRPRPSPSGLRAGGGHPAVQSLRSSRIGGRGAGAPGDCGSGAGSPLPESWEPQAPPLPPVPSEGRTRGSRHGPIGQRSFRPLPGWFEAARFLPAPSPNPDARAHAVKPTRLGAGAAGS